MEQRITLVTLGVEDVERSRAFYEALGWHTAAEPDAGIAFFQAGGMILSLWSRESLTADTGVEDGGGYGGVTLGHNVGSSAEVDAVVAGAEEAGATITRAPAETFWGGYSGVFTDLDGHAWEVAHNPHWELRQDGTVRLSSG
jgi:hypothetical protein